MKHLLYSLGLSLICATAANAAIPAMSVQKMQTSKINMESVQSMKLPENAKVMAYSAAPTTKRVRPVGRQLEAKDFVGEYVWDGSSPIEGEQSLPLFGSMSIMIDDSGTDELVIEGFDYFMPLYAHVTDNKLVIPNQFIYHNSYDNVDVWFWNLSVQNGDPALGQSPQDYYFNISPGTDFYFEMNADGGLEGGAIDLDADKFNNHEYTNAELANMICIASELTPSDNPEEIGLYWICQWIMADRVEEWLFVDSEWNEVGNALFKDAWFPVFWGDLNTPEYEVPLYRNVADEHLFLLMDPYGPDTPYGTASINDGNGYLVFNIENPSCVLFHPLVYSATFDTGQEGDPNIQSFYCYNAEGYNYYIEGASTEDIAIYFTSNGIPLSKFNEFGVNGPTVTINNGCFGSSDGSILGNYVWNDGTPNGSLDLTGYIILGDGWDDVKDIISDNSNAPVEYFNLQGVRVANPEKGQIVIKRKGSEVSKMIAR